MGRGAMGTARAEAARDEAPTPTREDEKAKGAAADAKKRKAPATWQETMRDAKARHVKAPDDPGSCVRRAELPKTGRRGRDADSPQKSRGAAAAAWIVRGDKTP